jgi:hypothetical protein
MVNALIRAVVLASLLFMAGCEAEQLTQIILVVDTDLRVPADIDRFAVKLEHLGVKVYDLDYNLNPNVSGGVKLPATLALTAGKDPSQRVTITVTGFKDSTTLLVRRVRLPFAGGRQVMLRLNMLRSCANLSKPCAAGTTCAAGGCKKIDVDPATLPDWDEAAANKGLDAGPPADMARDISVVDLPKQPDTRPSDTRTPDTSAPDQATPDQTTPDQSTPDQTVPDKGTPDAIKTG